MKNSLQKKLLSLLAPIFLISCLVLWYLWKAPAHQLHKYESIPLQIAIDILLIILFSFVYGSITNKEDKLSSIFQSINYQIKLGKESNIILDNILTYYKKGGEEEVVYSGAKFTRFNISDINSIRLKLLSSTFTGQSINSNVILRNKISDTTFFAPQYLVKYEYCHLKNVNFEGHCSDLEFQHCLLDNVSFYHHVNQCTFFLNPGNNSSINFHTANVFNTIIINPIYPTTNHETEIIGNIYDSFDLVHDWVEKNRIDWKNKINFNSKSKVEQLIVTPDIFLYLKREFPSLVKDFNIISLFQIVINPDSIVVEPSEIFPKNG